MDIFGSITTALAVALLSISPATPEHISTKSLSLTRELPSLQSWQVAVSEPKPKTVAQGEIQATEYIPPVILPTPAPAPTKAPAPAVGSPTGNRSDWLAASGIDQSNWQYVDFIISRESGWNPNATNPSSGAHGLPQALPYSKTGCGWNDAVCQLKWANSYAAGRYGNWAGAYQYWLGHNYW